MNLQKLKTKIHVSVVLALLVTYQQDCFFDLSSEKKTKS